MSTRSLARVVPVRDAMRLTLGVEQMMTSGFLFYDAPLSCCEAEGRGPGGGGEDMEGGKEGQPQRACRFGAGSLLDICMTDVPA